MKNIQTSANYAAWQIDESEYPNRGTTDEQIRFLLRYAILAPSTFNAQPWAIRIADSTIEIALDHSRLPQKSDATGRFGLISMGCFIGGIEVAAQHFDWNTKVAYAQGAQDPSAKQLVARVDLEPAKKRAKEGSETLSQLIHRATNRSRHQPQPLPKTLEADFQAVLLAGIDLRVYGPEWQARFKELSRAADMAIWSDIDFRREHVEWVRSNFTRKFDGMPGFGVGIGDIPSLLARPVILSPVFAKLQTKKNQDSLAHSNGFAVMTSDDTVSAWMDLGRSYLKICLLASRLGLSCAPMGQFIEHPETRAKLQAILDLPKRPQMFMRIGYPSQIVHHSPRRPVAEILY